MEEGPGADRGLDRVEGRGAAGGTQAAIMTSKPVRAASGASGASLLQSEKSEDLRISESNRQPICPYPHRPMTLARLLPQPPDASASAHSAPSHPPHGPGQVAHYLGGLDGRGTTAQGRASRAVTDGEVLGSTYQALIETYRQLCSERRKILEELIRWMDEHGGIRHRRAAPRSATEAGSAG